MHKIFVTIDSEELNNKEDEYEIYSITQGEI